VPLLRRDDGGGDGGGAGGHRPHRPPRLDQGAALALRRDLGRGRHERPTSGRRSRRCSTRRWTCRPHDARRCWTIRHRQTRRSATRSGGCWPRWTRRRRVPRRAAADYAAPLVAAGRGRNGEPVPAPPVRVGPYRVVGEAGRGGMGTVYLAERDDAQFRQRVALKLVRGAERWRTEHLLRRFREERQILASLEHPHIARLLDGGVTAEGRPYFAMEYVEGVPIDRYCEENALSVERRIELFCTVCDAVEYAHRRLVVHRDLKPSEHPGDGEGEPKLLDFGIAKLLAPAEADAEAPRTEAGHRLMTPEYASPEQVRGEPVTTATDVYSLGVLLYLLLSGRSPYAAARGAPHELARAILETVPERPSAVAPAPLARRLRGDLDTIVLRALHKEPERRYAVGARARGGPAAPPGRAAGAGAAGHAALPRGEVRAPPPRGGGGGGGAPPLARRRGGGDGVAGAAGDAGGGAGGGGQPLPDRSLRGVGPRRVARRRDHRPRAAGPRRGPAGRRPGAPAGARAEMLGVLGGIYRDLGSYASAEPLLRQCAGAARFARRRGRPADGGRGGRAGGAAAGDRPLRGGGGAAPAGARRPPPVSRRSAREGAQPLGAGERARPPGGVRRGGAGAPRGGGAAAAAPGPRTRGRGRGAREPLHRAARPRRGGGGRAPPAPRAGDPRGGPGPGPPGDRDLDQQPGAPAERPRRAGGGGGAVPARAGLRPAAPGGGAPLHGDRDEQPGRGAVARRGELDEAERLYRRALEIDRRLHGDVHPQVATVLNNLGHVLRDRGDYAGAERLYRRRWRPSAR
jgi:tRNA A-37 threonylcarbamoyl transferase component Bud32/tetratricopeptide (TPR) repeat protein